ncbi:MAG: thioredoxin family protein [Cycloclasticus sp.]
MPVSQTGFTTTYREEAPSLQQISQLTGYVILEFGAPWCGHCQTAEELMKKTSSEHAQLPHIKIFDGKGKKLGRSFKVKLWPTFILLHHGKEIKRLVRPTDSDAIKQLLAEITSC